MKRLSLLFLLLPTLALASPWTEGPKSVLVIRVDFTDLPDYRPLSDFTDLMGQVDDAYRTDSYGKVSLTSTITPYLRMPKTADNYARNDDWSIHQDAYDAAVAGGYNPDNYDRVIMHWQSLKGLDGSNMKWGGYGQIGRPYVWLNGWWNFKAVSHELGHTFGAGHAGSIQEGEELERGDPFDIMGWKNITPQSDFSPYFKRKFDWIRDGQIHIVGPGVYRIYRFDHKYAHGLFAIQVGDVLLSYRRAFTDNPYLNNGAQVVKITRSDTTKISQLDMTPSTSSDTDAALPLGQIYKEPLTGLSIKVVDQGGISPREYLDIQVF